jgi:hypothetical protein
MFLLLVLFNTFDAHLMELLLESQLAFNQLFFEEFGRVGACFPELKSKRQEAVLLAYAL